MATAEQPAAQRARTHTVYRLADGTEVPGATTVVSLISKGDALLRWAWELGRQGIEMRRYRDALADIGTLAHQMIEEHLGGPLVDYSLYTAADRDRAENCVLKFFEWEKSHQLKPCFIERPLVSERHRFGGTVDVYGLLDGIPTVLDLKTAKAVYDSHLYQAAAYAVLVREAGHPVEAIRILQIGRDESEGFTERVVSGVEIERYWRVFRAALDLYYALEACKPEGRQRVGPWQR